MRRVWTASLSRSRARLAPLTRRRLWMREARVLRAATRTTDGRSSSTKLSSAAEKRGSAGGRGRVGFLSQLRSSSMGYHRASVASFNPDCGSVSATLRSTFAEFECQVVGISRPACAPRLRRWATCALVAPGFSSQIARVWRALRPHFAACLRRNALPITDTELRLMAAAASIGLNDSP